MIRSFILLSSVVTVCVSVFQAPLAVLTVFEAQKNPLSLSLLLGSLTSGAVAIVIQKQPTYMGHDLKMKDHFVKQKANYGKSKSPASNQKDKFRSFQNTTFSSAPGDDGINAPGCWIPSIQEINRLTFSNLVGELPTFSGSSSMLNHEYYAEPWLANAATNANYGQYIRQNLATECHRYTSIQTSNDPIQFNPAHVGCCRAGMLLWVGYSCMVECAGGGEGVEFDNPFKRLHCFGQQEGNGGFRGGSGWTLLYDTDLRSDRRTTYSAWGDRSDRATYSAWGAATILPMGLDPSNPYSDRQVVAGLLDSGFPDNFQCTALKMCYYRDITTQVVEHATACTITGTGTALNDHGQPIGGDYYVVSNDDGFCLPQCEAGYSPSVEKVTCGPNGWENNPTWSCEPSPCDFAQINGGDPVENAFNLATTADEKVLDPGGFKVDAYSAESGRDFIPACTDSSIATSSDAPFPQPTGMYRAGFRGEHGITLFDRNNRLSCNLGTWSPPEWECLEPCAIPATLHATDACPMTQGLPRGGTCTPTCETGYSPIIRDGVTSLACDFDGQLTPSSGFTCGRMCPFESVRGGANYIGSCSDMARDTGSLPPGSTCIAWCESGYAEPGGNVTCNSDGTLSHTYQCVMD